MQLKDKIIFENADYVVVNKAATVSTVRDKTGHTSVQNSLEDIYKRPTYPITRLDKVVSGACLFALSKEAAAEISNKQSRQEIKKEYIAIVEGKVAVRQQELSSYIRKQGNKSKIYKDEQSNTKKARLHYKVIKHLDHYSIVLVTLETGRFHQIRAQLADMGHPIKGDVKYGAKRKNRDRSIHLHSWRITIGGIGHAAPLPDHDSTWEIATALLPTL